MAYFLGRRILLSLLTLLGATMLIFVLLRVVPGNVADILFDSAGFVDQADKERIEVELGLDQPIYSQYLAWIGGLLRGDLGYSYVHDQPVATMVAPRIPITLQLAGLTILFSVVIGVPFGLIAAAFRNGAVDYALRVITLGSLSMPSFWVALLTLIACLGLFGHLPLYAQPTGALDQLRMLVLPAAVVGLRSSALIMRFTRAAVLEVARQDFVRTARAKGIRPAAIQLRHILRNAAVPLVTVIGVEATYMVAGLIVTEQVFNIPGVAGLLIDAINWRDYPIVQALAAFIAASVVIVNLCVDLAYGLLDPRIRMAG